MPLAAVELILITLVVATVLWDIFLYLDGTEGNTISQIIIKRTQEYPLIPFAMGALVGHWFW